MFGDVFWNDIPWGTRFGPQNLSNLWLVSEVVGSQLRGFLQRILKWLFFLAENGKMGCGVILEYIVRECSSLNVFLDFHTIAARD